MHGQLCEPELREKGPHRCRAYGSASDIVSETLAAKHRDQRRRESIGDLSAWSGGIYTNRIYTAHGHKALVLIPSPYPLPEGEGRNENALPEGEGRNASPGKTGRKARAVPAGREKRERRSPQGERTPRGVPGGVPGFPPSPARRAADSSTRSLQQNPVLFHHRPRGEPHTFPPFRSGKGPRLCSLSLAERLPLFFPLPPGEGRVRGSKNP